MMANLHQIISLRHSKTRNSSSESKNEKISPIARENNYKWVYSPLQKKIREKMREKDSTQPVHKPLAAKNDLLCIPISYLLLSSKFFESRRLHDTKSFRKKTRWRPAIRSSWRRHLLRRSSATRTNSFKRVVQRLHPKQIACHHGSCPTGVTPHRRRRPRCRKERCSECHMNKHHAWRRRRTTTMATRCCLLPAVGRFVLIPFLSWPVDRG